MQGIDRRSLQNFDWMLFGLVVVLVGIGLVKAGEALEEEARELEEEGFRPGQPTLG